MKIEVKGKPAKMNVPNKPIVLEMNLVGYSKDGLRNLVTVRWYQSSRTGASTIYCCLWTYAGKLDYRMGSGIAGGYGYCKRSAAFAEALENAGLAAPFDSISGAGMFAVKDAIMAIGNLMGYEDHNLIVVGD